MSISLRSSKAATPHYIDGDCTNLSIVHTRPSIQLWQRPNVSIRFIAMLVILPYPAPPHSPKQNHRRMQVLFHLCTTFLYLISQPSRVDFLLIDQLAASLSSLANRVLQSHPFSSQLLPSNVTVLHS
jgi:hypothetical protein